MAPASRYYSAAHVLPSLPAIPPRQPSSPFQPGLTQLLFFGRLVDAKYTYDMAGSYANLSLPISSPSPVLRRSASAMLYTGMSNRLQDRRTAKKFGDHWPVGPRLVSQPSLKKFDGAARRCTSWDPLRKEVCVSFTFSNRCKNKLITKTGPRVVALW